MSDFGSIASSFSPLVIHYATAYAVGSSTNKLPPVVNTNRVNASIAPEASGSITSSVVVATFEPMYFRKIHSQCMDVMNNNSVRDDVEGTPTPPSLYIPIKGSFKFKWTVQSGSRTIQISTKQPCNQSPRPTLLVRENSSIGVNAISASAPGSTGWANIGPVTINPTTSGVVWVEVFNNVDGIEVPCWFDNIVTT